MAEVFISYSKKDHAAAEELARRLTARGFDVWWDFQLYTGDDFHEVIRTEIQQALAVVVIWSEASVASQWVRGEAQEAFDLAKLLPTYCPGFDPKRVPINFRALHTESVENIDAIVRAIERKCARPRGSESERVNELQVEAIRARSKPTLEATNEGKIDATGALFVGDLKFPFAKADNRGAISIAGIKVVSGERGTTITPQATTRSFPQPSGEFSSLSAKELANKGMELAGSLRAFHNEFWSTCAPKMGESPSDREKRRQAMPAFSARYRERCAGVALALASEMMARIGKIDDAEMSSEAKQGATLILMSAFAGPTPAASVAAFIELLSQRLTGS
jgi:TIR domain